jgi:SAM-dependent methyltransferase
MHGLSVGALFKTPTLPLWANVKSFVDMGGSRGHLSAAIVRAHPHIKGIVCDLPEVKPAADEFISKQGLGDRLVYQSLNFLEQDFPKVDAVVIAHTLFNWGDDVKDLLVKKSFECLSPGGVILVVEYFLDSDRKTSY